VPYLPCSDGLATLTPSPARLDCRPLHSDCIVSGGDLALCGPMGCSRIQYLALSGSPFGDVWTTHSFLGIDGEREGKGSGQKRSADQVAPRRKPITFQRVFDRLIPTISMRDSCIRPLVSMWADWIVRLYLLLKSFHANEDRTLMLRRSYASNAGEKPIILSLCTFFPHSRCETPGPPSCNRSSNACNLSSTLLPP